MKSSLSQSAPKRQVELAWWADEAIRDKSSRLFAVTAGLGSGKTHGVAQWHYDRVVKNKGCRCSCDLWPIYHKVVDSGIPTYRKILASTGLIEGRDFKVTLSPFPRLIFAGGHEVHFVSAEKPEHMVSVEYSHAAAHEVGSLKEEVIKLLRTRVRDSTARVRQIFLDGVPQGLNWYAEWFDDQTSPGWAEVAERDYLNAERQFRRFRCTTYDNQDHLPADYIPELIDTFGANPAYIQAYIHGIFCALVEGNCYKYDPTLHDVPDEEPTPFIDLYLSLDFNANPMAWVSLQKRQWYEYGVRGERMLALHCAETGATQLEEAMIEFAAKHPVRLFKQTPIWVYGDMSGHAASHKVAHSDYETIKHYLRAIGYERVEICALRYNPLETMTVDAVNRWLQNNYLFLCRRCSALRKSLMSTRWKEGTKKIDKPAGETHTHHGDALKYVAYALQEDIIRKAFSFNL